MEITAKAAYLGKFRCEATHLHSGDIIRTDAPRDNHGEGAHFSPTDLCAMSLGVCGLTTIGILGKDKLDIQDAYVEVTKVMSGTPRRIGEIHCAYHLPAALDHDQRAFAEKTAKNCPVALSLNPEIRQEYHFYYDLA